MANLLTGLRLLLVAPTAYAFANQGFLPPLLLVAFVIVAIATDYFDGKVARLTGSSSPAGQLFDHSTDFLFVTSGLAGAAFAGLITPILPVLIVIAFAQYVLDSHFFYHEKQLHMSFLGRWNGILYFVPLCIIAMSRLDSLIAVNGSLTMIVAMSGWVLVMSTIASIVDRALAPLRAHQKSD